MARVRSSKSTEEVTEVTEEVVETTPEEVTEVTEETQEETPVSEEETMPAVVEVVEEPGEEEIQVSAFQAKINELKDKGTMAQKTLIQQIEEYMNRVAPGKPMDPEQGALVQATLWRNLSNLINNQDKEFDSLWNIVLAFFNEHAKGVFHERYVFRFFEQIRLSDSDTEAFQRLLNLIKLTANVNGRKEALKQVDLDKTLKTGFTEAGRQRILNFYSK